VGRPRVPDRLALEGIVYYVLRSGIPWNMLPKQFGCCGVTYWRHLRDGRKVGGFERLHQALLDQLGKAGQMVDDYSGAAILPQDFEFGGAVSQRHPEAQGWA
jgi:transposase